METKAKRGPGRPKTIHKLSTTVDTFIRIKAFPDEGDYSIHTPYQAEVVRVQGDSVIERRFVGDKNVVTHVMAKAITLIDPRTEDSVDDI